MGRGSWGVAQTYGRQLLLRSVQRNARNAKEQFSAVLLPGGGPLPDATQFSTFSELLAAAIQSLHGVALTSAKAEDYHQAQQSLLRQVQLDCFPTDYAQLQAGKPVAKNSRLITLAPEFETGDQLIRVGGRLRHSSQLEQDAVHPVVLDAKHPITRLLIQDYDRQLHHPGPERVFAEGGLPASPTEVLGVSEMEGQATGP